ncbi:MAG: hypothetical protein ACLS5K_10265 [Streptococcus salivarius]
MSAEHVVSLIVLRNPVSDGSRLVLTAQPVGNAQISEVNYAPERDYQEGSGKYDATLSRDRGEPLNVG